MGCVDGLCYFWSCHSRHSAAKAISSDIIHFCVRTPELISSHGDTRLSNYDETMSKTFLYTSAVKKRKNTSIQWDSLLILGFRTSFHAAFVEPEGRKFVPQLRLLFYSSCFSCLNNSLTIISFISPLPPELLDLTHCSSLVKNASQGWRKFSFLYKTKNS